MLGMIFPQAVRVQRLGTSLWRLLALPEHQTGRCAKNNLLLSVSSIV
jgi:hypothetical protein